VSRPLRILVTGSRNWRDRETVRAAIETALGTYATIGLPVLVHGDCVGADTLAHIEWMRLLSSRPGALAQPEVHRADWKLHGRAAGPIRNQQMVDAGATVCLAFPLGKSIGTRGCMAMAAKAGIPVVNYGDEED
jgi:hypothetical protein